MSLYLRDEFLKNISINVEELRKIERILIEIREKLSGDDSLTLNLTVRFDNKGFKAFDFETLTKYFEDAQFIERIVFVLQDSKSLTSNQMNGRSIELFFDSNNPNNCFLRVQSDEKDWVECTFHKIMDVLLKFKNKNHFFRNAWLPFVVQLTSVAWMFLFSLWIAQGISGKLSIENPFVISFIGGFLIFSNIWTFLYPSLFQIRDRLWPNIAFKEKGNWVHWIIKNSLIIAFGALFLYIANKIISFAVEVLSSFLK